MNQGYCPAGAMGEARYNGEGSLNVVQPNSRDIRLIINPGSTSGGESACPFAPYANQIIRPLAVDNTSPFPFEVKLPEKIHAVE